MSTATKPLREVLLVGFGAVGSICQLNLAPGVQFDTARRLAHPQTQRIGPGDRRRAKQL